MGWFHEMETGTTKIDGHHRADERFVLIGRTLLERIVSKTYCENKKYEECQSLGQLYDADYGGISLRIWLSKMDDVVVLPMNAFLMTTIM